MSHSRVSSLALSGLIAILAPAALAFPPEVKVENPEFVAWSKFKPGTIAIWKSVIMKSDSKTETTITRKLVTSTDKNIVLEVTTSTSKDGGEAKVKTREVNVPRTTSESSARQFTDPVGKQDEGSESLTIAGKTYDARWIAAHSKGEDGDTKTKIWTAANVPGGLLKKESKVGDKSTTIELIELKLPSSKKKAKSTSSDVAAAASIGKWYTDYEKAAKLAKEHDKMLLLDFTGSDWCGWCKRLDKEVFTKDEFKEWAGEKFILVKLDFPRKTKLPAATKKQNDKLAKRHGVQGFPTIIVLDSKERAIARLGYAEGGPKAWIEQAENSIEEATED